MLNFEFQNPWILLLLLALPFFIFREIRKTSQKKASLKLPSLKAFGGAKSSLATYKPILFLMRIIAMTLCIVALARPRYVDVTTKIKSDEGVDILLTVDTSLSMLARDLKPDRLTALKDVAKDFSLGRKTDRIGLVEYSGEALTRVPLTTDRDVLTQEIEMLHSGSLADGTAIGIGLATAVNHLKNSKAKSKVIILITDGVESINPSGDLMYVSPRQAADIAKDKGIKVYTIGIGTRGKAPYPFQTAFGVQYQNIDVDIDETSLKQIASLTGGEYYRATDNNSLTSIYEQIDQLEKTKFNVREYSKRQEEYRLFALIALMLMLLEFALRHVVLRRLP